MLHKHEVQSITYTSLFFFVGILYFVVGVLKKGNSVVIDLMVMGEWVVGVFQTSTFFR